MDKEDQHKTISELHEQLQCRCGIFQHRENHMREKHFWSDPFGLSTKEKHTLEDKIRDIKNEYLDALLSWLESDYDRVFRRYRFYRITGDIVILLSILIAIYASKEAAILMVSLYFFGGYTILYTRIEPWRQQVDRLKQIVKIVNQEYQRRQNNSSV